MKIVYGNDKKVFTIDDVNVIAIVLDDDDKDNITNMSPNANVYMVCNDSFTLDARVAYINYVKGKHS